MIKKQYVMKILLAALLGAAGAGQAADINKGGQLYAMHCASCHGGAGVPVMPGLPNFQRGEKLLQADLALLASIRQGRGAMPAYMGMLRDREIMDVIAYLRTLQR